MQEQAYKPEKFKFNEQLYKDLEIIQKICKKHRETHNFCQGCQLRKPEGGCFLINNQDLPKCYNLPDNLKLSTEIRQALQNIQNNCQKHLSYIFNCDGCEFCKKSSECLLMYNPIVPFQWDLKEILTESRW